LLAHPLCVGVGEIGIDYGPWNDLGQEVMVEAFRSQLEIAREYDLPTELHLRDGENDTLAHDLAYEVLKEVGVGERGVDLHCFTSGPDVMLPFTDMGAHIAFGGALTFGRSDDIREAAIYCPTELILSETDCPYMAPHPIRGQEAEPAMVAITVERLSEVFEERRSVAPRDTYKMLWDNANAFFGL
jgi:TatD DNase family protein